MMTVTPMIAQPQESFEFDVRLSLTKRSPRNRGFATN